MLYYFSHNHIGKSSQLQLSFLWESQRKKHATSQYLDSKSTGTSHVKIKNSHYNFSFVQCNTYFFFYGFTWTLHDFIRTLLHFGHFINFNDVLLSPKSGKVWLNAFLLKMTLHNLLLTECVASNVLKQTKQFYYLDVDCYFALFCLKRP